MNAEVPADYATLLQLREMFGITGEIAKKIERGISMSDNFVI